MQDSKLINVCGAVLLSVHFSNRLIPGCFLTGRQVGSEVPRALHGTHRMRRIGHLQLNFQDALNSVQVLVRKAILL